MTSWRKQNPASVAGAVCGAAALLIGIGVAQPAAAAAALPPGSNFFAGSNFTGAQHSVDLSRPECVNLAAPAASAVNLSSQNIAVYFDADCKKGAPGADSDLWFSLSALHTANFPAPAVSYQVTTTR